MGPEVLGRIQVRRLRQPLHHPYSLVRKKCCSEFRGVLRVAILLEDDVPPIEPLIFQRLEELITKESISSLICLDNGRIMFFFGSLSILQVLNIISHTHDAIPP